MRRRAYGNRESDMAVELTKLPARTVEFTGEVKEELKKVTWPDWPQLKNATFVIIVFIIIVSAIIWGMDLIVNLLIGPRGLLMGLFR